jgi:N-methylhydantoinase A
VIRQVTVKRGLDVRDFVLTTFGGSGSLLACRLLDVLGLPAALVPNDPGTTSAFGLLTVDVRNDYVQTFVTRHLDLDPAQLSARYRALERQATDALDREGFPRATQQFLRSADLRYAGQAFEVRVTASGDSPDGVVARFHDEHQRLYGYSYRNQPAHAVEWVNLRVTGVGPIARPELPAAARAEPAPEPIRTSTRRVYFDHWVDTPVYSRRELATGAVIAGPAVIEEFGATLPLHPGFTATVDAYGNLVVTR